MKHAQLYSDLLQASKGEPLSSGFSSTDGILTSVSTVPHCGDNIDKDLNTKTHHYYYILLPLNQDIPASQEKSKVEMLSHPTHSKLKIQLLICT